MKFRGCNPHQLNWTFEKVEGVPQVPKAVAPASPVSKISAQVGGPKGGENEVQVAPVGDEILPTYFEAFEICHHFSGAQNVNQLVKSRRKPLMI